MKTLAVEAAGCHNRRILLKTYSMFHPLAALDRALTTNSVPSRRIASVNYCVRITIEFNETYTASPRLGLGVDGLRLAKDGCPNYGRVDSRDIRLGENGIVGLYLAGLVLDSDLVARWRLGPA